LTAESSNRSGSEIKGEIERKIRFARASLFWEKVWRACWPAAGFLGLFLAGALFDVWSAMSSPAHLAVLASTVLAAAASFWISFWPPRLPTKAEAERYLEKRNTLTHRPISQLLDDPSSVERTIETQALWRAQVAWATRQIGSIRRPWPRPRLLEKDPYALRSALALLLIVSFVDARGQIGSRLERALWPQNANAANKNLLIDAWVTPPEYTKAPPIFIADSLQPGSIQDSDDVIATPIGSVLFVKINGMSSAPPLHANVTLPNEQTDPPQFRDLSNNAFEARIPIETDGKVRIGDMFHAGASWTFATIPDTPPEVEFLSAEKEEDGWSLLVNYILADDYGLTNAGLTLIGADEREYSEYLELAETLEIVIDASTNPGERTPASISKDLTAHPWAGRQVRASLWAQDSRGQSAEVDTPVFTIPERLFIDPLAKAIIEQRKDLIQDSANYKRVAEVLDALAIAPELFSKDAATYLTLRSVFWRLQRMKDLADTAAVVDILWDLALHIEDDDESISERDLLALQEELQRALAEGASDEEIERLINELRAAMDRYLKALAKQARENPDAAMNQPFMDRNALQLEKRDLDDLLDAIKQLSENGAKDTASELLSQLKDVLQNLQVAGLPGQATEEQKARQNALQQLGDMIGRQRGLMDETFNEHRNKPFSFGDGGQPSESDGEQTGASNGLQERQNDLRQSLGEIMNGLGGSGMGAPSALGRADEAMNEANRALNEQRFGDAVESQKQAIDQLRDGAQNLAQELMDSLQSGGIGANEGRERGRNRDPLGRPSATSGPDFGESVRVPSERARQRAREILHELRRRAAERDRPVLELEYLDRLLKRF
jgi:uncharacterized protein (TIGR02302 family)